MEEDEAGDRVKVGPTITKTIMIQAAPSVVWDALTDPDQMKIWMAEPEMSLEVETSWDVGSPIVIKGFHHIRFVNKGRVLQFEPNKKLRYNYLSSISRLPDEEKSYSVIDFVLEPLGNFTSLVLTLSNFPDEVIRKHLDFYWGGTLNILKKYAEK